MATSISATGFKGGLGSSFHGSWGTSVVGEDYAMLAKSVPNHVRVGKPVRAQPIMKNVNEGKGFLLLLWLLHARFLARKGSISSEEKQLLCTLRYHFLFLPLYLTLLS